MIIDPEFQTPLPVCKYMVKMVPKGTKTILEPSPGLGNIVSCMKKYQVTAAADFFLLDKDMQFDAIVMNPPFSERTTFMNNAPKEVQSGMRVGYYFLTECMKMSDHVIALMPWFTLTDSDLRLKHLENFGIKSITALPRKTFNYTRIQTCVIELHKGWTRNTIFKTFDFPTVPVVKKKQ